MIFGGVSPLAIGASALRVAARVGQREACTALESILAVSETSAASDPRVPRAPKLRSGHGDAAWAVSHARALVRSLEGDWERAALLLYDLASAPVELDADERALYAELYAELAARDLLNPPAWL